MGKQRLKAKCRGFTILETTIAMSIIVVGLLGVTSLLTYNLQAQGINRDTLVASLLAQEGLELVRNARDTNWLLGAVGDEWKLGKNYENNLNIVQDGHYTIDHNGVGSNITINGGVNSIAQAQLYLDNLGFYTHVVGANAITPFFRLINVVDNGESVAASSTVRWQERGRTHDYVAETVFYNWR